MSAMNTPQPNDKYGPLPLVIGITGHRDLRGEDVPKLEEMVRAVFAEFRQKCPNTPLLLLSPLAEGADQLAARVAVNNKQELGLSLIVPLPMRRELYEADFEGAALDEFKRLLAEADYYFHLPLVGDASEADIGQQGEPRNLQYEQVGAYVVRHCHVLLALWDGVPPERTGGTAQIVDFQLKGLPPRFASLNSPLDQPETGPVYHVRTPRRGQPPSGEAEIARQVLLPPNPNVNIGAHIVAGMPQEQNIAKVYERIYARMDTFNRDARERAPQLAAKLAESQEYLFPTAKAAHLPAPMREQREHYATADTLAIFFQKRSVRTLVWLYVFVWLAIVLFDLYGHIWGEKHWLLLLYLAVMLLPFGVYWRAKRGDYQNKYQDYRALAEGMRVQFFWCLAGLKLSAADHYLRKQKGELDWIRSAVRVWNIAEDKPQQPAHASLPTRRLKDISEHWVADQADYFRRSTHRDQERLEEWEQRINLLVVVALLMVVLLALVLIVDNPCWAYWTELLESEHWLHGLWLTALTLLLAFAALAHSYVGKLALSEHTKQYRRMHRTFAQAEQNLGELIARQDTGAANKLLTELGKEALEENGDWVMLHRERPLEVPHPG